MRLKLGDQAFKELESMWYKKLHDSGFTDIENYSNPDRPLKSWDSFRFVSVKFQTRKAIRTPYQIKIDAFANDQSFQEVIQVMVKHSNNLFDTQGVEKVWELHRNGYSERGIATEMKCSKSCIHYMLKRMREWMSLVV